MDFNKLFWREYRYSRARIDLPDIDEIRFGGMTRSQRALGLGGRDRGGYVVTLNTIWFAALEVLAGTPVAERECVHTLRHELVHVAQTYMGERAGHNPRFYHLLGLVDAGQKNRFHPHDLDEDGRALIIGTSISFDDVRRSIR